MILRLSDFFQESILNVCTRKGHFYFRNSSVNHSLLVIINSILELLLELLSLGDDPKVSASASLFLGHSWQEFFCNFIYDGRWTLFSNTFYFFWKLLVTSLYFLINCIHKKVSIFYNFTGERFMLNLIEECIFLLSFKFSYKLSKA